MQLVHCFRTSLVFSILIALGTGCQTGKFSDAIHISSSIPGEAVFKDSPQVFCSVAVEEGMILGYATYMLQYSTWDASYYSYLDCIFMRKAARSKRIGEQLMNQVKRNSKELGAGLIQWQTPDFNVDIMRFYKIIGATSKPKECFFWE